MTVDTTVLRDEPPERTQRQLPGYAAQALSWTGIEKMSKGLVAYEVLHLAYDRYEDSLTMHEADLFDQLSKKAGTDARALIDEAAILSTADVRNQLVDDCTYEFPEEQVTADLFLPSTFVDSLQDYAVGDDIERALVYTIASPWESRLDRMGDLRKLHRWTRGETTENESSFVASVISNDSSTWDAEALHSRLSDDLERFERPDLTVLDLRDWGAEIKQVPAARAQALQTALMNYETPMRREGARRLAASFFDDVTSKTAHKYADAVDLETVHDGLDTVRLDVGELIKRLEQEAYEGALDAGKKKLGQMEDFEIAGFERDPREFGGHVPREEAEQHLRDIAEARVTYSGTPFLQRASEEALAWVKKRQAEVNQKDSGRK
jgi:hypothetical protein